MAARGVAAGGFVLATGSGACIVVAVLVSDGKDVANLGNRFDGGLEMMPDLLRPFPRVEKLARRLVSLYPLSGRLGTFFWKWYAFLEESEAWTVGQLRSFQWEQLQWLLPRLAESSPFYAKRLAGVSVQELKGPEDLGRLIPPLSRREFADHFPEIQDRNLRRRARVPGGTSGTTGSPLRFFHPVENRAREWASICHQWKRVGYDPARSRRAEFRGLVRPGRLFQEYPEQNMVRFSILDLRAETLPRLAAVIADRRLKFFHGYPSALYLLAQEILRSGLRFPAPDAVLLASEMVYDFQQERIQTAFPHARLFAHYGCAECTVLGAWCEHRRTYHLMPQYSLVETDDATGEILGTNLYNDLNGFLRYRMTDSARGVETSPCPACGRPYTPVLTGLDGRQEDYLYSRERGWIPPAIVTYPLKHLHGIQELQFHQDDPDQITLQYVVRPGTSGDTARHELEEIETGLRRLIGSGTRLHCRAADDIPRGPTGKYKWIVSRLDPRTDRPGRS